MRDELPKKPWKKECGIVNFNKSTEPGTHWVAYYKDGKNRFYFDSYGQVILQEIADYLKTESEKKSLSLLEIQTLCKNLILKYAVTYVCMSSIFL